MNCRGEWERDEGREPSDDDEVYSDFVLLWLIAHASRFLSRNDGRPESCWLEVWSKEAAEQGVAAHTDLRGGVEKALEILGQGFVSHPKNTNLRDALRKGEELRVSDQFQPLLRVTDLLIDGPFLLAQRDPNLHWRGSRNQRLIRLSNRFSQEDLQGKESNGEIILSPDSIILHGVGVGVIARGLRRY